MIEMTSTNTDGSKKMCCETNVAVKGMNAKKTRREEEEDIVAIAATCERVRTQAPIASTGGRSRLVLAFVLSSSLVLTSPLGADGVDMANNSNVA